MIFDTHAHYDDARFDEDREELFSKLEENGVGRVVNVGSSLESCYKTIEIINNHDNIYGAIGIHPCDCSELSDEDFEKLKELYKNEKVVAVGEIGLDYYYDDVPVDIQKNWFVKQLNLARELKLPVIIHSRDAAKDTLDIMKAEKSEEIGGVIHCFSYSKEIAMEYVKMGFFIGVGGVVTFNNGKKLKEVVQTIPIERIVLETDCPYLSPVPLRGKRNSSINLTYVVSEISKLTGISEEEIKRITWENAHKLYN